LAAIVKSIVTVAGKPSGTQATKIPMAKFTANDVLLLLTGKAMPKKTIAVATRSLASVIAQDQQ
jgi:hypothetical protein